MKFLKQSKKKRRTRDLGRKLKKARRFLRRRRKSSFARRKSIVKTWLRKNLPFFRHLFMFFLLFSTVYVLYQVFFVSHIFKIEQVTIRGDSDYVNFRDVQAVADTAALSKNIFTLNTYEFAQYLSKTFLAADEITVKKKLPDKVQLEIAEREPIAVVQKQGSPNQFIVDSEGFVLGMADERFVDYPTIDYEEDILVGRFLDKNMIPISQEIIDGAYENDLKVSSMSFADKYTRVFMEDEVEVIFSNEKSINLSIDIVASLLRKLALEGRDVRKVDLRYDKVVVSYD